MILFFVFNDTATTEIYTLSLHDALPISPRRSRQDLDQVGVVVTEDDQARVDAVGLVEERRRGQGGLVEEAAGWLDRKSTRLNSSHANISYAVFCLKKKNFQELSRFGFEV